MRIIVSACLLGECCKYSGGHNRNERVLAFIEGHEVIPVCPEVMGGLPVPRPPAEIVDGVVMNNQGVSVDAAFRAGVRAALARIGEQGADLAILQPRSPSCGVTQVYDGSFSGVLRPGQGLLAEALTQLGIRCIDADRL